MSLPAFGVRKPVPVNLLMIAMLLAGLAASVTLRRQFFPESEPEMAQVTLPYPGASPEEIEETLARKVEDAIADLDEVDELTTSINEGGGFISVKFRENIRSVTRATDEVEREIESLTDLPEDAERIEVTEFENRLPVIMVSLFGEVDEEELKTTIRGIRDDLKTLPGMGEVLPSGIRDYEIRVDVDPAALIEHRVSLPQVSDAIRGWMSDIPGGSVRGTVGNVTVRTLGVEERSEAIRDIVVKATSDGQSLRVGDIATVREDFVDSQIETRFNGAPSVSLTVFKVGAQDIVEMAEMVRAYIAARRGDPFLPKFIDKLGPPAEDGAAPEMMSKQRQAYELGLKSTVPLPKNAQITTHSDLARFVEGRLDLLVRNAGFGAILVFATLLVFLNWRVAFWVGIGLTTALSGTLVLMWALDITLNLLTMFGLIVVLGLLVDDAIVVAENIQARHDRGESSLSAAVRGADEVAWPVFSTVMTSIVAFLPLTFIRGQIGDLLGALPIVVACALIMSLIESLLILPSHMGHSLMERDKRTPGPAGRVIARYEKGRDGLINNVIVPRFGQLLGAALRYRYFSVTVAIAALVVSLGWVAGGRLPWEFLPSSDSETIIVDLEMPIGSSIDETNRIVQQIEAAAQSQTEVSTISAVIGQSANIDTGTVSAAATHIAQIFIELLPTEDRTRESSRVIDSIREMTRPLYDEVETIRYSEITGGPAGADITIQVAGTRQDDRLAVVDELKRQLRSFDGVYDISDNNSLGQPELQITLKPGAAGLGFTVSNVAQQVRGALFGLEPHVFSDRQEDIDVRVRLDEPTRRSLTQIESIWLISPTGQAVPLGEVAELVDGASYASINRVDRKRTTTLNADTAEGVSPEAIVAGLKFDELRTKYPDVEITFGGRQEQQADAFQSLPFGFLAAIIMIYVILAWLFSSYTQPLAVMMGIPFAIIGVVWGHALLGYSLTFLSLIGFVALSGIVVNDSLILVQFYNRRREEGMALHPALVDAGRQRLRPIFLTTVTTVLGLLPLMLEQSFQAKFLIPMAIAIAFGLISATVLILIVLPCLLVILDDVKRTAYFLWHAAPRPAPDAARPAFYSAEE